MPVRTVLPTTYRSLQDTCTQLRKFCLDGSAVMAAGNVSGNAIAQVMDRLVRDKATLLAIAAVPGIVAYIQNLENDAGYDITAEVTALLNAIDALGAWMIANVPTVGWVTFSSTGVSVRQFTPAETATIRAGLDAIAVTVA